MDLNGKHVLMMAPKFFGYENSIKEGMEKMGASVHLYDERNSPTSVQKILYRKARFLMDRKILRYYQSVCQKERAFRPDYVLFVNPETVNEASMGVLRESFPQARFLLYMWDSCENKKIKHMFHFFDKCYSFDRFDCDKYQLQFLPLFYVEEFQKKEAVKDFRFAFSFIGTAHSDRVRIVSQICDYCKERKLPYFVYIYVPGKTLYILRSIFNSDFRRFDKKYIHTEPLSKKKVAKILDASSYILDISHPKQTGLTMRTIEMIGLKRKIITTNQDISYYDFYNPVNQIIIDRKDIRIPDLSLSQEYVDIPEEIYRKYSLASWIREIFS